MGSHAPSLPLRARASVPFVSTPPFVDLPEGVAAERWSVRGTQRAVLHAGLDPDRPCVVLVPGFTGSKEDFIAMLPLLAHAGVGAVAFDQLGQYESDGSDDAADYAIPALAGDVAEVMGLVGAAAREVHLMGHSFGGLVAQEVVVGGRAEPRTLTLLCTGPGALPAERWGGLPDLVAALDSHDLPTIWQLMRDLEEPEPDGPAPEVQAFLERRWHANSPLGLREFATHLMVAPSHVQRLAGCAPAITVMWGEHDDAWPTEVQRPWAAALGADAVELPGLGHSPNAEDPESTVAALLRAIGHGRGR